MQNNFIFQLLSVLILTLFNIIIVKFFPFENYIYLIVFIINYLTIYFITYFNKNNIIKMNYDHINVNSVAVFIRVLIFSLPIIGLVGFYIVGITNEELGIEEANTWISFILAIAAFIMSLITLWQSQQTYNRIFDMLDKLKEDTNDIKKNTEFKDLLSSKGITLGISDEVKSNLKDLNE